MDSNTILKGGFVLFVFNGMVNLSHFKIGKQSLFFFLKKKTN